MRDAVAWQPDLILLDVMMPGMDGYECCRRLKADAKTKHIPIVMVTALGEAEENVAGAGHDCGGENEIWIPGCVAHGIVLRHSRIAVRSEIIRSRMTRRMSGSSRVSPKSACRRTP